AANLQTGGDGADDLARGLGRILVKRVVRAGAKHLATVAGLALPAFGDLARLRVDVGGDGARKTAAVARRFVLAGAERGLVVEEQDFERGQPLHGDALAGEAARLKQRGLLGRDEAAQLAGGGGAGIGPEENAFE